MFTIQDGREHFYQWDTDRKLIVEDKSITQVHFCNRTDSCSLVVEVKDGLAEVPNVLLQTDWKINVYAYDGCHTKHSAVFNVVKRTKPADYVYTETEVKTFAALEERMDALENMEIEVSPEDIETAVDKYFEEHEISGASTWDELENKPFYTTGEDVIIIAKNDLVNGEQIGSVELKPNETYYVTFDGNEYECTCRRWNYVPTGTGSTGRATEVYLGNGAIRYNSTIWKDINKELTDAFPADNGEPFCIYARYSETLTEVIVLMENVTEVQPTDTHEVIIKQLAPGAHIHKLSERYLPDSVATEEEVAARIKEIQIPDVSSFVTKTYVDNAIAAIDIPDISALASTDYVDEKVSAIKVPDTSSFVTMTQVEGKGYQTEAQVNSLITAALGVIENGTY